MWIVRPPATGAKAALVVDCLLGDERDPGFPLLEHQHRCDAALLHRCPHDLKPSVEG